jgi:hypothetical protein
MSNKDRYDLQLKAMADALSQSIVDASDQEIQEDARLTGVDLDANAARLKRMLTETAKRFHKRKFYEAQTAYPAEVEKIQSRSRSCRLPETPFGRLSLLQSLTQRGIPLTMQGRDLDGLPDSDVISLLEELAALGMLPDDDAK